jgi:hypothetical protein
MTPIEQRIAEIEMKLAEPDVIGIDWPDEKWLLSALRAAVELAKLAMDDEIEYGDWLPALLKKSGRFLHGEFENKGESI